MLFNINIIQKIGLKILGGITLLIILNLIYSKIQFPIEQDKLSPYDQMLDSCEEAEVIFLGDCSDVYCKEGDTNTSVHLYLENRYPEKNIIGISDVGFQPNSFLQLLHALASRDAIENKTILITLNLRAFAPHIIADRYYTPQINQALVLSDNSLPKLYNRLKVTLKEYDYLNHDQANQLTKELESTPYLNQDSLPYTSQSDWIIKANKPPKRSSYLSDYAFELTSENERIKDFDAIAEFANKYNVDIIFFMVPINYQLAEKYFGEPLTNMINENLDFIKARYQNESVQVLDRSRLFKKHYFIEEKSNSHLTNEGKKMLGNSIRLKFL